MSLTICGVDVSLDGIDSPEELAKRIAEATGGSRAGNLVRLSTGQIVRVTRGRGPIPWDVEALA